MKYTPIIYIDMNMELKTAVIISWIKYIRSIEVGCDFATAHYTP